MGQNKERRGGIRIMTSKKKIAEMLTIQSTRYKKRKTISKSVSGVDLCSKNNVDINKNAPQERDTNVPLLNKNVPQERDTNVSLLNDNVPLSKPEKELEFKNKVIFVSEIPSFNIKGINLKIMDYLTEHIEDNTYLITSRLSIINMSKIMCLDKNKVKTYLKRLKDKNIVKTHCFKNGINGYTQLQINKNYYEQAIKRDTKLSPSSSSSNKDLIITNTKEQNRKEELRPIFDILKMPIFKFDRSSISLKTLYNWWEKDNFQYSIKEIFPMVNELLKGLKNNDPYLYSRDSIASVVKGLVCGEFYIYEEEEKKKEEIISKEVNVKPITPTKDELKEQLITRLTGIYQECAEDNEIFFSKILTKIVESGTKNTTLPMIVNTSMNKNGNVVEILANELSPWLETPEFEKFRKVL